MPNSLSPLAPPIFQALLGRPWSDQRVDEPTTDNVKAYEVAYAHRAGYILGANGEWIAEAATQGPVRH